MFVKDDKNFGAWLSSIQGEGFLHAWHAKKVTFYFRIKTIIKAMGVKRGQGSLGSLGFWKFQQKFFFLVSSAKKQISTLLVPPEKI